MKGLMGFQGLALGLAKHRIALSRKAATAHPIIAQLTYVSYWGLVELSVQADARAFGGRCNLMKQWDEYLIELKDMLTPGNQVLEPTLPTD
ncbi:hypothetical protein NDU88_006693 [Pleurodeles waltl]|uniref:Uncharacterized protein n=1 Tax=Pleurodeles waltl TaxID=8319 RepID=A0AAV7VRE9_PLEWA|nr:hypothetical protein NDU88_006693 [Pleurodeles waltl]